MSYTSLYRQFRPQNFSDMVGQDHITQTLKNQIISGRVGHAYLFNGGRGTGKTTSAKILARAVNCLNPKDGEPCNECEICKSILNGSLTDVVEMDAASNNSVDDIRVIRDEVNFLPTKAKYRVYVIDEVHMLSTGAFNALLKTLEEPPEHVKFILATTEPQKLPATILSRCQRFDFKKINDNDIVKRLKIICNESKINITDDALNIISVLSEGAMRDAISILERCSQENVDLIDINVVKNLVGLPSLEYISKFSEGILSADEIKTLSVLDEVLDNGKDAYNFLWEVIKYIKDILLFKSIKKLSLYSENEINDIKRISELVDKDILLNIIYELSELENNVKNSAQKIILIQAGIIRICMKVKNNSFNFDSRLKAIEDIVKKGSFNTGSGMPNSTTQNINISKNTVNTVTKTNQEVVKKQSKKIEVNSDNMWNEIIDNLKKSGKIRLYTCLVNTCINKVNDEIWEIVFPNGLTDFNRKILEDVNNKNDLIKAIFLLTGKEIFIKLRDGKKDNTEEQKNSYNGLENLGININIID